MPVDQRSRAAASIAQPLDVGVLAEGVSRTAPLAETVVMNRTDLQGLLSAGSPGRRRRHASDLTAEFPVVRRAEADAVPGRHRAPAGRHRADDGVGPAAPAPLTRPIRLGDVAAWSWAGATGDAG